MKIKLLPAIFFASIFLTYNTLAAAETFTGESKLINKTEKTIEISNTDMFGVEEILTITVPDTAVFSGYNSLAQIQFGDKITVEAEQDAKTFDFVASSVKKGIVPTTSGPEKK